MKAEREPFLWAGLGPTALAILASRLLGLARDSATAALLGMSAGGVMDAFVLAFRIPNLFRRLFGEGALTASYLPVLAEKLEQGPVAAGRLAGSVAAALGLLLGLLVLVGELLCGLLFLLAGGMQEQLLFGLTAALLPYAVLICLTALFAGTLQMLRRFTAAAAPPVLLNLTWLLAALYLAPRWGQSPTERAWVLAGAILLGGVLQLGFVAAVLRGSGFPLEFHLPRRTPEIDRIAWGMGPSVVGLAATQFNTLIDSLIAWYFAPRGGMDSLFGVPFPLESGAPAATYFGERVYQFPLGIVGVAVATVIFPRLARQAAKREHARLAGDLTRGILLVFFLAIPASAGLMLLAEPLARLLFEHGEFTRRDTLRAAAMIAGYSTAVWAYCGNAVMVRGFHALGDHRTPMRVALVCMVTNLALNLTLIWPFAEQGLAWATASSAILQFALLATSFHRGRAPLDMRAVLRGVGRFLPATLVWVVIDLLLLQLLPAEGFRGELSRVALPVGAAMSLYFGWAWWARWPELRQANLEDRP